MRPGAQQIVDVTYSAGGMRSVVSPRAKSQLFVANYDYLFKVRRETASQTFIPSLGVGLHSLLASTNYLPNVELPVTYLTATAFLTLSGNVLYRLNKRNQVRMQIALPVAGIVYRPDFEINGKTLTRLTAPGKGGLFFVKLEYAYTISRALDITATYQYNYFSFDEPRPIAILQGGLFFGIRKKF